MIARRGRRTVTIVTAVKSPSLAISLGTGLLLGLLCLAAGQLALGMGHGWELPRRYGAVSLALYPLAFARWRWVGRDLPWVRDLMLVAGILVPILFVLTLVGALPSLHRINLSGWTIVLGGAVLYVGAGVLAARSGRQAMAGDVGLLVLGILLDAVALGSAATLHNPAAITLALPWVALWLGWQVVTVLALIRHR